MKLKHLELLGFKSFAKKSRLDFNVPVVGIVGPNGSGKSNVVEAFRFVLGEQSMKSLRGKTGKDLIFKGSKDLAKSNRASVEIVFDNKDKVFKLSDRSEPINLDFDEIILKREVFADGANNYYINNQLVRLKDIVELLASVNIGASGHHIISQGQADRILSASSKDRRTMVEDALGLKVYQYKLKDANKKLEKTEENMKEVSSLRRELSPHIKYLKKQVEKVEKGEELRRELSLLYLNYFKSEESFLNGEDDFLKNKNFELERELKEIEVKLKAIGNIDTTFEHAKNEEINKIQQEISSLERLKEDLSRKIGRIEGMIEFQKKDGVGPESISIKTKELETFVTDAMATIDRSIADNDLSSIKNHISNLKKIFDDFSRRFIQNKEFNKPENSFKDLEATKNDVTRQIEEVEKSKNSLVSKLNTIQKELEHSRLEKFKDQENRFVLENKRNKLLSDVEILSSRKDIFHKRKVSFEDAVKEAIVLVGREILDYKNVVLANDVPTENLPHMIERIKIKLEDIGTGSGADILKEYNEVTERDNFLAKELEDLEKSINNLRDLINDLKETLDKEFKEGLEKINQRFEEFFTLMFGGGNAYLSSVVQGARVNNANDDEEEILDEVESSEEKLEYGIDINVTLPQKKVKDLQMLSGGERSLTSIALVFAVTQVNPPPFLVLDETDAALDEANSKRYSDMVEKLSKYSQLITVTHNRETMSRADVIYGVTIGSDGSSKLLSIRFDEAESYAK